MKVVQSTKAYSPHVGGIETVVQQLAEGFVERHAIDSWVVCCSDDGNPHMEILNGVKVVRTATLARVLSMPISPTYPLKLRNRSAEILQIHEPSLLGALSVLLYPRAMRENYKRWVVWWHSDIMRQSLFSFAYSPVLRSVLTKADAIIVATPNHIRSSQFLKPFSAKCHVLPYGVDLSRFDKSPEVASAIDRIKGQFKESLILFVGRLVYYKGVEYLIRAMRELPDAHLVVVGSGPLEHTLKQIAAEGLNNVTFIPFLPEHELVAMYHACDVFVLPSVENSEAFGIVLLEAMACEKPVITAHLPTGVTYVNQDNVNGLVVPRRDEVALAGAIRKLLDDPNLASRLGTTGRARVERTFSLPGMVDRTVGLYKRLLMADPN